MGTLFGTDGIRGEANRYPMDGMTAFGVGQAVACVMKGKGRRPRIIIGRDTRISGPMLEHSLAAGIAAMGGDAHLAGVLPTPGVAFLSKSMAADAGIVISASHNPYEDNGIKIFSGSGFKLSDAKEASIEALVLEGRLVRMSPPAREMGQVHVLEGGLEAYVDFLKASFPTDLSMAGMKVVLDTANGSSFQAAPALFVALGGNVDVLNDRPDGKNINLDCGSQATGHLQKRVTQRGAAIGLAFDGDADRLIAVDEIGRAITGDQILLICALDLKRRGKLKNDQVVSTVMSNLGLIAACRKYGLKHHASAVGDRYVMKDMLRLGSVIGGENSGHLIFLERHTTGDGMLAALQLIAVMLRQQKPLSELADSMTVYPQALMNVGVERKPELSTLPRVVAAIERAEAELGEEGRVLVRYSGTQNLCRVMVEGPTLQITQRICAQIADAVKRGTQ